MFCLIGIPVLTYLLSVLPILPAGANNDWAGFLGGYLGAIVGAVVALYVLQETVKEEKTTREREEKINYFNNLIVVWSELARAAYDFCVYIGKYKAEFTLENSRLIEIAYNMYSEESRMRVLINHVEILLATRRNVYEVDEILEEMNGVKANITELLDAFLTAGELDFESEKDNEVLFSKQIELENDIKVITEMIKETTIKSLYQ